jgi:hypothetical protein
MVLTLDDFPTGCEPQTSGLADLESVAMLPPTDLVAYFSANPQAARRVLQHSYDKRYSPSTFIEETNGGYQVGWFDGERRHLVHFAELAQAAADYLLFSFGRGRLRAI